MQSHLPGIFYEQQALTEQVVAQRLTALRMCAQWIQGTTDLDALVKCVNLLGDIGPGRYHLSTRVVQGVRAACVSLGVETPVELSLSPINTPGLLIQWRVVMSILSLLGEDRRDKLRATFPAVEELELPEAVDSHFHLDRTAHKLGLNLDYERVASHTVSDPSHQVKVTGGVAVFCDPATYPTQEEVCNSPNKELQRP